MIKSALSWTQVPFVLSYFLTLILGSVVLSFSVYGGWKYLVTGLLVYLIVTGIRSLTQLSSSKLWRLSGVEWLAVVYLGIELFFAALPVYRKDQWNYSLILSKQISKLGELKPPIFDDHIFFTGVYEFWGLVVRSVSSDDLFNQSFCDAFTLSCFFVLLFSIIRSFNKRLAILAVAAIYAGLPERDAVVNLKPDIFLLLAAIYLMLQPFTDSKPNRFLTGFLVGVLVAFKLTWLHFASVFVLAKLLLDRRSFRPNLKFIGGGILGLIFASPFFVKNYYFFKNPFHPMQTLGFHSYGASEHHVMFWRWLRDPARNLPEYFVNLWGILDSLSERWLWFFVPIVLFSLFRIFEDMWFRGKLSIDWQSRVIRSDFALMLLCLGAYLLVWPLFYQWNIFNRFVYAGFCFPAIALLFMVKQNPKVASLLLLVPVFAASSLDVHLRHISKHSLQTRKEFFATEKPPLSVVKKLQIINQHRSSQGFAYDQAPVLMDHPMGYYLNGPKFYRDYHYVREFQNLACVWPQLEKLGVRYLFGYHSWPEYWGPRYLQVRQHALKIDDGIWFLDDQFYADVRCIVSGRGV